MQSQIGNPDGPDKPNKKKYDPRSTLRTTEPKTLRPAHGVYGSLSHGAVPVRSAEESTVDRLQQCFSDLNCVDILGVAGAKVASAGSTGGLP